MKISLFGLWDARTLSNLIIELTSERDLYLKNI